MRIEKNKKFKTSKKRHAVSLLDILDKRLIVPNFQVKTKEDALNKIVDKFYKKRIVREPWFFHTVLKYGQMTERSVYKGIAFCWAPSITNYNSIAGLFIHRKGVNFGWYRSRSEKTHIFMVVTGKPQKLIKCIYDFNLLLWFKLAKYKGFKEELIKAKSVDDVIDIIEKYGSKRCGNKRK